MHRWLVAVGLTVLAVGPVAVSLVRTVPSATTRPLTSATDTRSTTPLEVGFPAGSRTGGIPIAVTNARWLREVDTLALLVATYDTRAVASTARLGAVDGSCEFRLDAAGPVPNNGLLLLRRVHCQPTPGTRDFMFWIRLEGEGRVAIWTSTGADPARDQLVIGGGGADYAVRGDARMGEHVQPTRRVDMVAYLWRRDAPTIWFWILLVALMAATGLRGLRSVQLAPMATGAAAIALAAGVAWALVMPPLQGADEPDHLLSFAEVTAAPQITEALPWLAQRTHFERLRFQGHERFRPADVDRPHEIPWTGDIHAERMDQRSAVAAGLWRAWGRAGLAQLTLPDALLAIRVANAGLFALVVGVCAAFAGWTMGAARARWRLLGLAILPTLPYFAMVVSDWAIVASWATLLATGLVVLADDGPRADWGAWPVALAIGLLAGTTMTVFMLAPLVAGLMLVRVLAGGRWPAAFWGGWLFGALVTLLVTRQLFASGFARYDAAGGTSAQLLAEVNDLAQLIVHAPWLVVMPIIAAAAAEWTWQRLIARTTFPHVYAGARALTMALVAIAAVSAAASLVVSLPAVDVLGRDTYPDPWSYVVAVVAAGASGTRLLGFDHLTFTSLVSGFGWVDAILPVWLLAAISAALIAGLWAATRDTGRQCLWLVTLIGASGVCLATAAAAGYFMNRNLHGRYILTIGLPAVAVVMSAAGRRLDAAPVRVRVAVVGAVVLLHGLSVWLVLERYL